MPQLFSRRADTILRAALAGLLALLVVAVLLARGVIDPDWFGPPAYGSAQAAVPQPSDFSHRLHVGGVGIQCRMCHVTVAKGPVAGFPQQETCASCHLALDPRPEIDWIVAWNRVQPLPPHVYFHHGIHVSRGIGCATCHGPVETMERLYPVREFSMQWCLDCHRDPPPTLAAQGIEPARLDHCYVCHR